MDTIQLQCGSCGQMMAISTAHLGSQVGCPHCQAVVQTPPPPPRGGPQAPMGNQATIDMGAMGERESIFGQPEPTDDLFDGEPAPRLQMPPREVAPPESNYAEPTVSMEPVEPEYDEPPHRSARNDYEEEEENLAPVAARRLPKKSTFVPTLLIFLVPYAVFTTAFIAYLLMNWPRDNPLKKLPDNAPKGQPRVQIKHDLAIDPDMKVALQKSIRVGDIEVTPLQVKLTNYGDLVLVFRAKNLSDTYTFNPISDEYLKYTDRSMDAGKPYTFLERQSSKGQAFRRLYGGNLEWLKGSPGREQPFDGEIGPGQEAVIHVISEAKHRKELVPSFVNAAEPMVWRIQVRRGMVPVDGAPVSATTVIGVDFTARDIVRTNEDA